MEKELARLVDALAQLGYSPAVGERLRAVGAQRAALAEQAVLAAVDDADDLVAAVVGDYRAAMLDLKRCLDEDPDRERTRELLRQMLAPGDPGARRRGRHMGPNDKPRRATSRCWRGVSNRGCGGLATIPGDACISPGEPLRRSHCSGPTPHHSPMPSQPGDAAAPQQLTDAQRMELRARLAHHRANPSERGVSMHELKAKLQGAGDTPQSPP